MNKPHNILKIFLYEYSVKFIILFLILAGVMSLWNHVHEYNEEQKIKEEETLMLSKQRISETMDIYSFGLGEEAEDRFIIGIGKSFNNSQYYVYIAQEDGGLKIKTFYVGKTTIYKTLKPDETAYVEYIYDGNGYLRETNLYVSENTFLQEYGSAA